MATETKATRTPGWFTPTMLRNPILHHAAKAGLSAEQALVELDRGYQEAIERLTTRAMLDSQPHTIFVKDPNPDLLAACKAAIEYDALIQTCANDPARMASACSATGDDLDTLYERWIDLARAALAKAEGRQ